MLYARSRWNAGAAEVYTKLYSHFVMVSVLCIQSEKASTGRQENVGLQKLQT